MNIITLSGPCGSGKSTLVNLLKVEFKRVRTNYKDCAGANLCSNSYKSKIEYTLKWFEEVKIQYYKGIEVLISDRSPFDCIAYLKEDQNRYENEVNEHFKELEKIGINLIRTLITADKDNLKQRIYNRGREQSILQTEIADLDLSLRFYCSKLEQFDFIFESNFLTPMELKNKIYPHIKRE